MSYKGHDYRSLRCMDLHLVTNKDCEFGKDRQLMVELSSIILANYDHIERLTVDVAYIYGEYTYMMKYNPPERLN